MVIKARVFSCGGHILPRDTWHTACVFACCLVPDFCHHCLYRYASEKPDPKAYLTKGEGDTIKTRGPEQPVKTASPPKAGAFARRDNPPNTAFRRFYERGDLPISVDHKSFKNAIKWKVSMFVVQ